MTFDNMRDSTELLQLRPLVATNKAAAVTSIEIFQNETLRPILKFQNDLFVQIVVGQQNYSGLLKTDGRKAFEKRLSIFLAQPALKFLLIGAVVGMFVEDELKYYTDNQKECNKRVFQMLVERLVDGLY